jgi:hypothetical protein
MAVKVAFMQLSDAILTYRKLAEMLGLPSEPIEHSLRSS